MRNYKKEKLMFGALKTVEEKNLYSSFGLTDGLSDCELEDINGGWCVNFTVTICSGNGNGNDSGNGNGSGNSGGSSGSSSSSSSSSS